MDKILKITSRLVLDNKVEIMFIVKNKDVLYFNQYVDELFKLDENGDYTFQGSVIKIIYKNLLSKTEVFVVLNEQESYILFNTDKKHDEILQGIALKVIDFISKNNIDKQLNIKLSFRFSYCESYKLYKKNNKYYIVNNSKDDAYIISENLCKNSSNVEVLSKEFFEHNSIKTNITHTDVGNIDIENQLNRLLGYINEYGLESISFAYAVFINQLFNNEVLSIRLIQMLQFLREEADAASYSEVPEIRRFALELFEDEKFYVDAMSETPLFPIDLPGGPQQVLLALTFSLVHINMSLSTQFRIAIVRHISYFYKKYKEILECHNIQTYKECMDIFFNKYPEMAIKIQHALNLLFQLHNNDNLWEEKIFYSSGRIRQITQYKNNLIHGVIKVYYENGILQQQTNYKDGLRNGDSRYYYDSGKLKQEVIYIDDKINGIVKSYYENGCIEQIAFYKNSKLEGKVTRYFLNQKVESISRYKNDKKDGVEKVYYVTGILRQKNNYKNNILNGTSTTYYENGNIMQIETYRNGERNGKLISYYPNGVIQTKAFFLNGIQENNEFLFYENGSLKQQSFYKHGHKHGKLVRYYSNGIIKQRSYCVAGKFVGHSIVYYQDGSIHEIAMLKNNLHNGIVKQFFNNGNLKLIGYAIDDVYDGIVRTFYENGNIQTLETYRNGKLINIIKYD